MSTDADADADKATPVPGYMNLTMKLSIQGQSEDEMLERFERWIEAASGDADRLLFQDCCLVVISAEYALEGE